MARTRTGRRPGASTGTRPAILSAARHLFADRGYAGTSIRAVAARAEVDPALVHHYFGTKEGLFRATLEIPLDPEALLAQVVTGAPEEAPERLVRAYLGVWDSPDTGPAMVGLLRRMLTEPGSSALVRDVVGGSILPAATEALLADVDTAEAEMRMALVLSHMLGVVVGRQVLGVEPIASLPAEDLAALVTPTVSHYLRGELAASPRAATGPPTTTKEGTDGPGSR